MIYSDNRHDISFQNLKTMIGDLKMFQIVNDDGLTALDNKITSVICFEIEYDEEINKQIAKLENTISNSDNKDRIIYSTQNGNNAVHTGTNIAINTNTKQLEELKNQKGQFYSQIDKIFNKAFGGESNATSSIAWPNSCGNRNIAVKDRFFRDHSSLYGFIDETNNRNHEKFLIIAINAFREPISSLSEKLKNPLKSFFGIDVDVGVFTEVKIINGMPNPQYILRLNGQLKEDGRQKYNKKETYIENFNKKHIADRKKMFCDFLDECEKQIKENNEKQIKENNEKKDIIIKKIKSLKQEITLLDKILQCLIDFISLFLCNDNLNKYAEEKANDFYNSSNLSQFNNSLEGIDDIIFDNFKENLKKENFFDVSTKLVLNKLYEKCIERGIISS